MPAVANVYNASTTANVITSSLGSTLSVADPSPFATGRLVNGTFSLAQPLQIAATSAGGTGAAFATIGGSAAPTSLLTYPGPISNDTVTLNFRQPIAVTDPLRTGSVQQDAHLHAVHDTARKRLRRAAALQRGPGPVSDVAAMRLDQARCSSSDVRRSVDFYTGALGLTEVPRPPTFDAPGAWLAIGEAQQLHLVGEGEPGRTVEMNPPWDPAEVAIGYTNHLAFHVDDLDAALERAA